MSSQKKALVVEDSVEVLDLIALHLKREGIEVMKAVSGDEAESILQTQSFNLIVVDWMLPGISGIELTKRIRAKSASGAGAAILLVTAKSEPTDIVLGLESGADDYVTKPFEIPVLLARVRALLRRTELAPSPEGADRIQIENLVLDHAKHEVLCKGKKVELTTSEYKLLAALLENRGRVLSRKRLIDLVQGENVAVVLRTIDTHIYGLRKKLGECSELVESIRGVGYRVRL